MVVLDCDPFETVKGVGGLVGCHEDCGVFGLVYLL